MADATVAVANNPNIDSQLSEVNVEGESKAIVESSNDNLATRQPRKRKTRGQKRREKMARTTKEGPYQDNRQIVKSNESMERFYRLQSFLKEDEFDQFMNSLRESLPASFRINTFDYGQALVLRRIIQEPEFWETIELEDLGIKPRQTNENIVQNSVEEAANNADELGLESKPVLEEQGQINETTEDLNLADDIHIDDQNIASEQATKLPALEPLCWYPKRMGWQMNVTRVDMRKSPSLQKLHKFIMAETDNGFISRQEVVSMIPPLLLDIKRGQNVLDMCAAPGSKTAQLLEYLKFNIFDGDDDNSGESTNDPTFDDGIVVANDVDNKRCYMLVHQSNRLNSPNCVIVNEDASRLPGMKSFVNNGDQYLDVRFDRVLCDVPCSGDGTLRKNPDVWRKWSMANANNFHGMQTKILKRGIELLKDNGILVYSTCSMNPMEDEAVISSVLRASQGKVTLLDAAHRLPGLKYRQGVSQWTVMTKDMEVIHSFDQVKPEQVSNVYPSLFPPTSDEAKQFNLHKCIRMLPHVQNTGAFFVAVLKKLCSPMPWEEMRESKKPTSDPTKVRQPPSKRNRRFGGFKEDPFLFMKEQDSDWVAIKNFYGIGDGFPVTQLAHRGKTDKKRNIHLFSKSTRNFIIANQEEPGRTDFVKIINGGMRLFVKAETRAGFRICQDGVSEIMPYVKSDLKVSATREDIIALLKSKTVRMEDLSCGQHLRNNLEVGSFIFLYEHKENDKTLVIPLMAWRGEYAGALYVSNTYRVHLSALVQLKMDKTSCATGIYPKDTERDPK